MSYPTNNYPTGIQDTTNPTADTAVATFDHAGLESFQNDSIEALKTKVGVDGSAVTTTHDYKLSGVIGSDKAVSKTGAETLTNKTLTSPTITNKSSTGTDSGTETLVNKTLTTPTIGDLTNAQHDHSSASKGGQLNATTAFSSGTIPTARLGSGVASAGTYLQGDQTWGALTASFISSDGSDGDVTISPGTTTLTRNMYYNNLTVNGTATLNTAGYKIFVKNLTIVDTSGGGGGIQHNGNAGGNATAGTGGTGATALTTAFHFPTPIGGGNGANGVNNSAGVNATGTSVDTVVNTNNGANGGTGGGETGYLGGTGTGGTSTVPFYIRDLVSANTFIKYTSATAFKLANMASQSSGGGSGGASSGTNTSGGGGGGGGCGGFVFITTKSLSLTGTGCIQANGGNGGNGGNGTNVFTGGGGGGGGGNGGVVVAIYSSKTGTGTMVANGGTGGTKGTNSGALSFQPTNGANGNAGLVIEITG